MALPQYTELTDFQKWFFFYLVVKENAPTNLEGVSRQMCLTVKMNIDVDKYEDEQKRLRNEAQELVKHGLLEIYETEETSVDTGEPQIEKHYEISDKGELYLFQKILGPIVKANEKNKRVEIINYFSKEGRETQGRVKLFLDTMNTQRQEESLKSISQRILDHSMPMLKVLDAIHKYANILGIT